MRVHFDGFSIGVSIFAFCWLCWGRTNFSREGLSAYSNTHTVIQRTLLMYYQKQCAMSVVHTRQLFQEARVHDLQHSNLVCCIDSVCVWDCLASGTLSIAHISRPCQLTGVRREMNRPSCNFRSHTKSKHGKSAMMIDRVGSKPPSARLRRYSTTLHLHYSIVRRWPRGLVWSCIKL